MKSTVAAVDIGGTKIAAAIVDRDGIVLRRAEAPTPSLAGAGAVLEVVAGLVRDLSDNSAPVRALGVGSAGMIDPTSGRVVGATDSIAGWAGTDLAGGLAARTGLATAVINDVHTHALGEGWLGAARSHDSALFVAVGTGVGGALLVNGSTELGAHSAAGHVGHVPSTYARDLPCSCGAVGHLEAIACGPALVREYARRAEPVRDLQELLALAATDAQAAEVIRLGGEAVGSMIGGLLNVLDPEVVVVGGGVANLGERWWDALVATAQAVAMPFLPTPEIMRSSLGGDAPLLGAARLAWRLVDRGLEEQTGST